MMKTLLLLSLFAAVSLSGRGVDNVHQISVTTMEGKEKPLSEYAGKVLLVVNTASKCGYTPQYADLQKLYEEYKDDGLVILGFPANNFGNQEPGSDEEILEFCNVNYGITFPMFSKVSVRGEDQHPLFNYLTGDADQEKMGNVNWNFEKFLIDKDGRLVKRFRSRVKPTDEDVTRVIERYLEMPPTASN